MTKKRKERLRHQVKSRFYYLFWGAATVSVFAGQMYVGTGYRKMSHSIDDLMSGIKVLIELPTPKVIPVPDTGRGWEQHPMIIK